MHSLNFAPSSCRGRCITVRVGTAVLIQPSHHVIFGHGCEVVEVETLCNQDGPDVRRYQLVVKVRGDRQL